ncbi:DNA mismatch repair protein MutS, partial [hydrothermal vent metagenome]
MSAKESAHASTPMMRQYREIKIQNPDAILFFRMGDFYEMFGDDAVKAAKALNISLTSRDKASDNPVPMCGIPFHALETYLPRMIRSGFKVAICEQMEAPTAAKGIVKREVTRVITPGAIMEPAMLEERSHNFLCAIKPSKRGFGLCSVDLSTGLMKVCEFAGEGSLLDLLNEIDRIDPKQILVPDDIDEKHPPLAKELAASLGSIVDKTEGWTFSAQIARETLLEIFNVKSLDGFGLEGMELSYSSAGASAHYLRETQKGALAQLNKIAVYNPSGDMLLDPATRRNLELTKSLMENTRAGSLLDLMDQSVTPMGARILKEWILRPLVSIDRIRERLETVRHFVKDFYSLSALQDTLDGMGDMERIASRLAGPTCSPRDVRAYGEALRRLPPVKSVIDKIGTAFGRLWIDMWDNIEETADLIERAIDDDAPTFARDGGMIRKGYSEGLDDLKAIKADSRKLLLQLETDERERTGVHTLKIKYNRVYGYFIEISRKQADSVPEDWMRKQSLVNSERFVSPRLKELEEKILTAEEKAIDMEMKLYQSVMDEIRPSIGRAQIMAAVVGEVDALSSLARLATMKMYNEPVIDDGDLIEIKAGRHPIIEATQMEERFVPNDTTMDRAGSQLAIVTGPNMAGKSTYIRQVALITLMAQVGSYVPAESARIGVCDRIFTRVGAQDHLQKGQSTFMVEMNETAMILNNATSRSLIILDEIGRGTSTFDGISIAWAVAEYIHKVGARTMFATHYHELTELSDTLEGVRNLSVAVKEWNDEIVFLRKIIEEGADRSYGIQVARLAGLPKEVITRAGEILTELEANELDATGHPKLKAKDAPHTPSDQIGLFTPQKSEVEEELRKIDVEKMTPLEALVKLEELRKRV